jgi:hypothetical protein
MRRPLLVLLLTAAATAVATGCPPVVRAAVPAPATGTVVHGSVEVAGKRVPLPSGAWLVAGVSDETVALRHKERETVLPVVGAVLFRLKGGGVDAFAFIHANAQPGERGWGLPRDCLRTDIPFTRTAFASNTDGLCVFVNHVVTGSGPAASPAWTAALALARARGWSLPYEWLMAGVRVADRMDILDVRYHFDPALFGVTETAERPPPDWASSPWAAARVVASAAPGGTMAGETTAGDTTAPLPATATATASTPEPAPVPAPVPAVTGPWQMAAGDLRGAWQRLKDIHLWGGEKAGEPSVASAISDEDVRRKTAVAALSTWADIAGSLVLASFQGHSADVPAPDALPPDAGALALERRRDQLDAMLSSGALTPEQEEAVTAAMDSGPGTGRDWSDLSPWELTAYKLSTWTSIAFVKSVAIKYLIFQDFWLVLAMQATSTGISSLRFVVNDLTWHYLGVSGDEDDKKKPRVVEFTTAGIDG